MVIMLKTAVGLFMYNDVLIFQYTVAGTNGLAGHHALWRVIMATNVVQGHVATLYPLTEVMRVLEIQKIQSHVTQNHAQVSQSIMIYITITTTTR